MARGLAESFQGQKVNSEDYDASQSSDTYNIASTIKRLTMKLMKSASACHCLYVYVNWSSNLRTDGYIKFSVQTHNGTQNSHVQYSTTMSFRRNVKVI